MNDALFWMQAQWGARVETPTALADRLLITTDALKRLSPLFDNWNWGDVQEIEETEGEGGVHPFADLIANLSYAIQRNTGTGDEGTPDPFYGYLMMLMTKGKVKVNADASHGERGGVFFHTLYKSRKI